MSAPLGSADFFALEAGECLDQLEMLIAQPETGDASQMLRYARALRGSALMANQTSLARAAAGFEALARAVRDGKRSLDAVARERASQAVDDVRHLVRRVKEWTPNDEARSNRIASELAALAGGEVRDPRQAPAPAGPPQAQTGVRAFVAREGALVASALDRAARSLESTPEAREPLYAVLRRMQSLRGLAELGELTPLPEVLDGIELAVGDLTRLFAPPPGVPELLDAAAAALTRIARDVAERGTPDPAASEPQLFTDRLLRAFASEADVIPVTELLDTSLGDAIVRSAAQPQFAAPSPLGAVELVSHGEHLAQSAEQLMNAPSSTARDLRLYALVPAFRAASAPGRDPLTRALARLATAACGAIADGSAAANLSQFAEQLRSAGSVLRGVAGEGPSASLAARLDVITAALTGASAIEIVETSGKEVSRARAEDSGVVAIESLAYDGQSVIQPLAVPEPVPDLVSAPPAEAEVVSVLALAPTNHLPLEAAFTRYHQLIATVPATSSGREMPLVDIMSLCYAGRAALERADQLRSEIASRLSREPALAAVEPLLRELLDLVPLAMQPV